MRTHYWKRISINGYSKKDKKTLSPMLKYVFYARHIDENAFALKTIRNIPFLSRIGYEFISDENIDKEENIIKCKDEQTFLNNILYEIEKNKIIEA